MDNVIIVNIHECSRHPGVIYAELHKTDGELCISATLEYIFAALKDPDRGYLCINAFRDGFGNFHINDA